MSNTPNNKREVLIGLDNLKQYFPVKGVKGAYVRANDGITLNIYKGETLGLVGESGCGKSTLGRTLLQLYNQTDGKTMYHGVTINDIAPAYVEKILSNYSQLRRSAVSKAENYDKLRQEFEAADDKEKLNLHDRFLQAQKDARHSFQDLVKLVGGFYTIDNPQKAIDLLLKEARVAKERYEVTKKQRRLRLKEADREAKALAKQKAFKPNPSREQKASEYQEQIDAKTKELEAIEAELDKLRAEHADDPRFQRYEKYRDDGVDLANLTYDEMRPLRQDMQLIFQDPYSSLNPRMTVGQIISEGLAAHEVDRGTMSLDDYVKQVMEDCGLQSYMIHRYPHQFSGGQRQRIGIARALALKPEFVVCDEAVSALDVSIQSQIINLLEDMKEDRDLTYLFISHDLSVVKYISDRIAVMYLGDIVELAPTKQLFDTPLHPYTEALLAAIPTTDLEDRDKPQMILEGDIPSPVNPPSGCKFHTRCRYATEECKHMTPELRELDDDHFVACHHPLAFKERLEAMGPIHEQSILEAALMADEQE